MPQMIDHVVVAVRDLAQASRDYARVGFTVTPGGEHTGGATHNALISFADGSYFELIAFARPDEPQEHRWWQKFTNGEGTVDFALLSADLDTEAEELRDAGIAVNGPNDGGRTRPDGRQIAWKMLSISSDDAPLPFVIEDVTTRELRVPPGAATQHPLGVTGIAGVTVLVPDLDRAAAVYTTFLGDPGEPITSEIEGIRRGTRITFGPHWIALAEPEAGATALQAFIADRGIAPYEIVLTGGGSGTDLLPLDLTHAARIRFA
jgi:catechol 2,3-dioxygenase-like lactoylglutathione lyase family enzyme